MTTTRATTLSRSGFTRVELIVVVIVLMVVVILIAPLFARARARSPRISCVNNLKQLGTAYRIWANDHADLNPAEVSATNGGWNEVVSHENIGADCWRNYLCISNELGESTRALICPADERKIAADFNQITNNSAISYFSGVGADDLHPQGILGGDRNLGPGPDPDREYGYSPQNGNGNDVVIRGPVCWSRKMHSINNPATGAGNTMLGDGSAQQDTSAGFRENWLKPAMQEFRSDARGPAYVGVRLIFP